MECPDDIGPLTVLAGPILSLVLTCPGLTLSWSWRPVLPTGVLTMSCTGRKSPVRSKHDRPSSQHHLTAPFTPIRAHPGTPGTPIPAEVQRCRCRGGGEGGGGPVTGQVGRAAVS